MVKVKVFLGLRKIFGRKEITSEAKNLGELLNKLVKQYEGLEDALFKDSKQNKLRPEIIILVNGRHIKWPSGLSTPLKEGDEVAIFPHMSGG